MGNEVSNETMTDARALEVLTTHPDKTDDRLWDQAFDHIAARLRGEAAQGEQQAVAYQTRIPTGNWSEASWETYERVSHNRPADARKLYTRPQPVAVAGDAVTDELKTILRDARALGYMVDTSITFDTLERAIAALSAAPAAPAVTDAELRAVQRAREWGEKIEQVQATESEGDAFTVGWFDGEAYGRKQAAIEQEMAAPAPVAGDAVASSYEPLDAPEVYRIWFEAERAWHQLLPKPDRNFHFAKALEAHILARLAGGEP